VNGATAWTNVMSERGRRVRREKGAAERKPWYQLREFNRYEFHFRQQAPIGPCIAGGGESAQRSRRGESAQRMRGGESARRVVEARHG
jgi:hypothetical protein